MALAAVPLACFQLPAGPEPALLQVLHLRGGGPLVSLKIIHCLVHPLPEAVLACSDPRDGKCSMQSYKVKALPISKEHDCQDVM